VPGETCLRGTAVKDGVDGMDGMDGCKTKWTKLVAGRLLPLNDGPFYNRPVYPFIPSQLEHHMEEIKVSGAKLKARIKELIKEGNVRRIIIRNPAGRTLLDMPLSAGVAGAVLLPFWAAVGTIAALATDYTIAVERDPGTTVAKG
jgi:hypothetical protein